MAYIIDGHNLIGILPDISLAQPDDESRLVERLLSYRAAGASAMIVFFDPDPLLDRKAPGSMHKPDRTRATRQGVEVRYAAAGKTADDAIVEFLRASPQPGQYAVVTNDAGLIGRVKAAGASVLRANEFSAQMGRQLGQRKQKKQAAASPSEAGIPNPRAPAFADLYDQFLAAEKAGKQSQRAQLDLRTWVERLYTGDPQLQVQAARVLGQSNDLQMLSPLIDALTAKDGALRAEAALALGALRSPRALPELIRLLQEDGNGMVREAAAQALGAIGSGKAATALEAAANQDPKSKVRKAARAALDAIHARKHP